MCALWPIQRAFGWFIGDAIECDDESMSSRQLMDVKYERYGISGFNCTMNVRDELPELHGINTVALFKAAVAIFNVHKTEAAYALFSSWEAARTWHFLFLVPVSAFGQHFRPYMSRS